MLDANPLAPFLANGGILILDGALATELERRGADLDDPLWSAKLLLEAPELIRQVHYDYFAAGADLATTASYQATFEGFARRGLDAAAAERLLRQSVTLAVEARDAFWAEPAHRQGRQRPLVAASVGCYGAYLANGAEYRGDYGLSRTELISFHRRRVAVLADTPADLLACETIPCRLEGEALAALLAEFPAAAAWLSYSCCDDVHVCHGEPFHDCVALANGSEQVVAVGLNCTPPEHVEALLRSAAGATEKPLLAYPNSGEGWDAARRCWLPVPDAPNLAAAAPRWIAAGARLVGGCCRTTPGDIRALAAALRPS